MTTVCYHGVSIDYCIPKEEEENQFELNTGRYLLTCFGSSNL